MTNELRSEYDLSELLMGDTRGKCADRTRQGTNLNLLALGPRQNLGSAEVLNAESVNEALYDDRENSG